MNIHAPLPMYVKVSRSQAIFDISRSTIYRMAEKGEIKIYKRGGAALLKVAEVEAWIEGRSAA